MKNLTMLLLVLITSVFSLKLSATTYEYDNGWLAPNGAPGTTLLSGDSLIITAGTYVQQANLTVNSGAAVVTVSGTTWQVKKSGATEYTITNNSSSFILNGKLELKNSTTVINNGVGIITVKTGGEMKFRNTSTFSNYGTVNVEFGGKLKIEKDSVMTNDGTLNIEGKFEMKNDAVFTNNGVIVVSTTGEFKAKDDAVFTNSSSGTVVLNGKMKLEGDSIINNVGSIVGLGKIKYKNGATPTFNNTGTINGVSGGSISGTTNLGTLAGITVSAAPGGGETYSYIEGVGIYPEEYASATCADQLLVFGDLIIAEDLQFGNLIVPDFSTLNVNSGSSLDICSSIENEGSITVESGGSLVQSTSGTNEGIGSYTIIQDAGQSSSGAYNIWSSPINGADLQAVYSNTNPCGMYVFNASTQEWGYDWNPATTYYCGINPVTFNSFTYLDGTPDGIMDNGRGYFIPGDSTAATQRVFTGDINNGSIPVSVYSTAVVTPGAWSGDDWNLIGNPYPSGIDPSLFWASNSTNLTDGLYFWDGLSEDYDVYNSGSATTPVGFVIAVGQGFYVQTDDAIITDGNSGTVFFENSMRDIDGGVFYKTNSTEKHNVSVSINTPSGHLNKIVVGYSNEATDGFDKLYDAHKLSGNPNIRFSSVLNDEEFIIQGIAVPKLGKTKSVLLTVFTIETGHHIFTEFARENIPTGMDVYLKDNSTGNLHDLTTGEYVVYLEGNQTYDTRFELVFVNRGVENDDAQTGRGGDDSNGTDVATNVEDVSASSYTLLTETNGYTLYNSNGVTGDIQVVSVTGTVVWSKNNVNSNSIQINLNEVSAGIYFIQVINNNERVYSNKIVNP